MQISNNNIVVNNNLKFKGLKEKVDKFFGAKNDKPTELPAYPVVGSSQVNYNAPVSYNKIADIEVPGLSEKASVFKLSNGQKVIILPKKGPAHIRTTYGVGSLNEPDNIRGISHFIEHNLLKGSKDLPPGKYKEQVKFLGGHANAETLFDKTFYFIQLQLLEEKSLEEGIRLNALSTQFPLFDEKELEEEKGVINQELDEYIANPDFCANYVVLKNLFNIKSSSSDLLGGKKENINALNRDIVLDYYNTWYTPDNAVTVITGDVDVDETMQLVSKYYNKKLDISKVNNRKYEKLKPITQPIREDIFIPSISEATISLGFPIENTTIIEQEKIKFMIDFLISPASMFSKRIGEIGGCSQAYIEELSSDKNAPKSLMIKMNVPEEKNEEALKILYEEITNFINNPPNDFLVQQLANNEIENMKNLSLDVNSISNQLVRIVQNNNLNYYKEKENALFSLNSVAISDLARKYLDLNKVSICVAHPKETEAKEINNENFSLNSNKVSFGKSISVKDSLNQEKNNIKQWVLNNNIYFSTMKTDNSADCSLKMAFNGDYNPNISQAEYDVISELLNCGSLYTGKDNYNQLIQQMNIGLGFSFENNTINVSSSFPEYRTNETINLIKSVLLNPNFTQAEFDIVKQNIRQKIINNNPSASDNLKKTIFPYDKRNASDEEQLKILDNMTLQDVYRIYYSLLNNSQCGVSLSLPKNNADFVEQTVANNLSFNMPMARPFLREKEMQVSLYQPNTQEKIICDVHENPKAEIIKSYQYKVTNNLEDKIKVGILETVLCDRLYDDLRSKQNLCYTPEAYFYNIKDVGLFNFYIQTSSDPNMSSEANPENVNKSIDGFDKHVQNVKSELITENELQYAKNILKTNLLNAFETNTSKSFSLLSDMNSYLGIDYREKYIEIIEKITAEDIKAAANYVFANKPITSIVASQYTLDSLGLKKNVQ